MYIETVKERYSCRNYSSNAVSQADLDYILECVRLAPSACNRQPWKIYAVSNEKAKAAVCRAYPAEWPAEAPYMFVFCGVTDTNWKRADGTDYLMADITIAADHFISAATEKGLGTCWIAAFNEAQVVEALNLPPNEKPIFLVPLGYAADDRKPVKKRKEIKDICSFI